MAILNQENSSCGVFTENELGLEFVYDNYGDDCSILEEIVRIEEESRQKLQRRNLEHIILYLVEEYEKDEAFKRNPYVCEQAVDHYYYLLPRAKRSKGLRKRPIALAVGCQSQLEKKSQKIRISKITRVVDKEKVLMEKKMVIDPAGSSSVSDLKTTKYVHEKVKRSEDLLDEKQSKLENREKKRKRVEPLVVPIEMPDELKEKIENMGVESCEVKLVIQKVLYDTDLSNKHMRMSIPVKQVRNKDFLTPQQKIELEMRDIESNKKRKIQFNLIEPSLEETKIHMAKWDMNRSSNYVLLNDWMAVAERNNLKSGMIVQLWSFRQDLVPWLALVLVPHQAALEG